MQTSKIGTIWNCWRDVCAWYASTTMYCQQRSIIPWTRKIDGSATEITLTCFIMFSTAEVPDIWVRIVGSIKLSMLFLARYIPTYNYTLYPINRKIVVSHWSNNFFSAQRYFCPLESYSYSSNLFHFPIQVPRSVCHST